MLVAYQLTACDPSTALVLRACLDTHLAAHRANRIEIWEPRDAEVWSRLHDLLQPIPDRCKIVEDKETPAREREIIVPAFSLDSTETAALLGQTLIAGGSTLAIGVSQLRLAVQALMAFVENALQHGSGSSVMVACAVDAQRRELELAALDLGPGLTGVGMREAVASSRQSGGGLASIVALGERRGIPVALRLASGAERARISSEERAHYEERTPIPGFFAATTIGLK